MCKRVLYSLLICFTEFAVDIKTKSKHFVFATANDTLANGDLSGIALMKNEGPHLQPYGEKSVRDCRNVTYIHTYTLFKCRGI